MRVLLVRPNARYDSIVPPIGLGYLATHIREHHDVSILDCEADNLGPEELAGHVERLRPEVIGLQMYSSDRFVVRSYLDRLGRMASRPVTVVGGPHPSSVPRVVLDEFAPHIDYAFAGEAEIAFARFLTLLEENSTGPEKLAGIPGLIWREPGAGVRVNPSYFHPDLDDLGMPAWDLLRPESYPHSPYAAFTRYLPVTLVAASRGCPNRCTFCAAGYLSGYRVRYRSPEAIADEIEWLKNSRGIREIQFSDDNLTADPDVVARLCQILIDRRLDVPWSCPNGVRVDSLSHELLQLMKRSGCYSLAVGIETGSRRLMAKIKKGISLDRVPATLQMIQEAGIRTVGYFILGLPTETPEERKQTVALALSLPLDLANFMLYCPLPGTPLFDEVAGTGRFIDAKWYNFSSVIHAPEGTTRAGLKWDQRAAFLRFYLRPRQMSFLLKSARSRSHLTYILKRINRWLVGLSRPSALGKGDRRGEGE